MNSAKPSKNLSITDRFLTFKKLAYEKHKDKYDYSKSVYKNVDSKMIIICKIHGEFQQTPFCHLKSFGCSKCSLIEKNKNDKRALGKEKFLEIAKTIHGDKYDYSKVIYKDRKSKIIIICKIHGEFEITPAKHRGKNQNGCLKCNDKRGYNKLTNDIFIKRAREIHKDRYDYSETKYSGIKGKVVIICKIHKSFKQIASDHLAGNGCVKCNGNPRVTKDIFIERSLEKHGNKYDYSKVNFTKVHDKVIIICKAHNYEFFQRPYSHMKGEGCFKCSCNTSKKEVAWLNHINVLESNRHKTLKINKKIFKPDAFDKDTNTIYEFYGDHWHGNPKVYHKDDINPATKSTYGSLYQKTIKRREFLISQGYNFIFIWEDEWNNNQKETIILAENFQK